MSVVSTFALVMVLDYRGLLTKFARHLWRTYQRPSPWGARMRAYYGDEATVRRHGRKAAFLMLLIGAAVLSFGLDALASGHVVWGATAHRLPRG